MTFSGAYGASPGAVSTPEERRKNTSHLAAAEVAHALLRRTLACRVHTHVNAFLPVARSTACHCLSWLLPDNPLDQTVAHWAPLGTCGPRSNSPETSTGALILKHFVGSPILAAAGFQPARSRR